jgi:ribonuclease HI
VAISQAIVHNAGELTVNTDSKFLINCIESWIKNWKRNGWKTASGQDVKNIDDLKKLDHVCSKIKVNWVYVPGHKGHYGNEEADKLARKAI